MGCPNDCIFCNQVKISGQKTLLDYEAMREGIMSSISTMKETDTVEIAFFGMFAPIFASFAASKNVLKSTVSEVLHYE